MIYNMLYFDAQYNGIKGEKWIRTKDKNDMTNSEANNTYPSKYFYY